MLVWGPTPRVELIREVIEDVSTDKVGCILTDNAAAMVKARRLVVARKASRTSWKSGMQLPCK
jgi:hypothetical protein